MINSVKWIRNPDKKIQHVNDFETATLLMTVKIPGHLQKLLRAFIVCNISK